MNQRKAENFRCSAIEASCSLKDSVYSWKIASRIIRELQAVIEAHQNFCVRVTQWRLRCPIHLGSQLLIQTSQHWLNHSTKWCRRRFIWQADHVFLYAKIVSRL